MSVEFQRIRIFSPARHGFYASVTTEVFEVPRVLVFLPTSQTLNISYGY